MRLSRLRLRLAAGFSIAFAVSLGLLAAGALGFLWYESGRRLDAELSRVVRGVISAVRDKAEESSHSARLDAVAEVAKDWPKNDDAFGILDDRGQLLKAVDPIGVIDQRLIARLHEGAESPFTTTLVDEDFRVDASPLTLINFSDGPARIRVVALRATKGIEADTELLAGVLAVTAPLILLISVVAGYALAGRSLRPMNELRSAIAAIAPDKLSQRLPAGATKDEIGALATEFNSLLERLGDAQQRNRRFLREVAHQIRTPLTLVLGEAGNELAAAAPTGDRAIGALARIRTAAEQMRRRVDELFLLAEAQAGERVVLDDDVELDGLVLECTDLMRGRATALGRTLAIGHADNVVIRGNAPLLNEALVELIENACRHGTSALPISVAAKANGSGAVLTVESAGAPFDRPKRENNDTPQQLGLPIVEWIARAHGGELLLTHDGTKNIVSMTLGA